MPPFAFIDLILIALAVYVAVRVFGPRRGSNRPDRHRPDNQNNAGNDGDYTRPWNPSQGSDADSTPNDRERPNQDGYRPNEDEYDTPRHRAARGAWDHLSGSSSGSASGSAHGGSTTPTPTGVNTGAESVPGQFDRDEFLRGAKLIFARLRESWDRRDVNDIAEFTTPSLAAEFRARAESDPRQRDSEVLLVEPSIEDVTRVEDQTHVQVAYRALVREDFTKDESREIRERWTFVRNEHGHPDERTWRVEAIDLVQ